MAAIRSLSMITNQMQTTQARVESGLRINKANDDPAVFAIAQNMRADLNAMTAVRDSLAFGKATLTVARDAATKISDELARLKQTVTQGQQQGIDQAQIQTQIDNALQNIDAYVNSATFNGVNLLNLSGNLNVIRNIAGDTLDVAGEDARVSGLGLAGLDVAQGMWEVSFDDSLDPQENESIQITRSDGRVFVFEFISDAGAALQNEPDANTEVRAVVADLGNISPLAALGALVQEIRAAGFGAELTVNGTLRITGAVDNVTDGATGITGVAAHTQIGGTQGAIAAVDAAIVNAGNILARLGAALRQVEGLQEFTKQLTDSVREGLGALVDADLAEESARLTSLQTKQQLAIQSLSIANQQSQALLGLFR
jgi:flagellin